MNIARYALADSGRVLIVTSGPRAVGVVSELAQVDGEAREVFDPNPQLKSVAFGEHRRVTWTTRSGEESYGVVVLPPDYSPDKTYPMLVGVYPSEPRDRFMLHPSAQTLGDLQAVWGYIVFMATPRFPQTFAYVRDERYAESARGAAGVPIMIDDVRSGIEWVSNHFPVRQESITVAGFSNGAYVVNWLMTTDLDACFVSSSGESNMTMHPTSPTGDIREFSSVSVFDEPEEYVRLSSLFQMHRVSKPVLLYIGDDDDGFIQNVMAQYWVMRGLRKNVQLVRYAGEGHYLTGAAAVEDSLARLRAFADGCAAEKTPRASP